MSDNMEFEIVLDEENEISVEYPMYMSCYEYALKNIFESILRKNNRAIGSYSQLYRAETTNIFPFIGERGTGKTTAMMSFCGILNNLDDNGRKEWLDRLRMNENDSFLARKIQFEVLPSIDASLLEDGEDLFELILANMFEKCDDKWKKGAYGYDKHHMGTHQEILRKFGAVYHNHRNLKYIGKQEDLGESVISKLRAMPTSIKTQKEFDMLLNLFFEEVGMGGGEWNYLVVVIDDLDLNIGHGFEMLEQLHKYLSHPQVIILTTFSYEQLTIITENHFKKSLRDIGSSNDLDEKVWISAHCRKLSQDYLDKLIPVGHRIYMPNLSKISWKAEVKEKNAEASVWVKKYVNCKIAENMKIYYDANGLKRHFSELNTVRTLVSYIQFLDTLNRVSFSECEAFRGEADTEDTAKKRKHQTEVMRIYDQNHEWFNRDIQERMAYEKLEIKQRTFFKQLLDIDLGRRAHYMIKFQKNWLEGKPLDANIDGDSYRYSDLLECIYIWGRASYADKPLIHCVLASFTSEMVREELNYTYNGVKDSRDSSYSRLEKFIGKGIGNKWTGEMLPVAIEDQRSAFYFAFVPQILIRLFRRTIYLGHMISLSEIERKIGGLSEKQAMDIADEFLHLLEDEKLIQMLECIELLSDNSRMEKQGKRHLSYKFEILPDRESANSLGIKVGLNSEIADFDIFAFVKKSLHPMAEHYKFLEDVGGQLAKALCKYLEYGKNIKLEQEIQLGIERKIIECVMLQSIFKKHDVRQECIAFPFYDVDVSYNVIKRVRARCKDEFINPIEEDDIATGIVEIYEYIEEEFEKQEEFYQYGSEKYPYKTTFSDYPFIKAMKELKEYAEFQKILKVFYNIGTFSKSDAENMAD